MARKTKKQPQAKPANHLRLAVTDFGPIARAEIDLRPLTVFVGPSNTGKSYLATLIYALHQFWSVGQRGARVFGYPGGHDYPPGPIGSLALDDAWKEVVWGWAKSAAAEDEALLENDVVIPSEVIDVIWKSTANNSGKQVVESISTAFGVDISYLMRNGASSRAKVQVEGRIPPGDAISPIKYQLDLGDPESGSGEFPSGGSLVIKQDEFALSRLLRALYHVTRMYNDGNDSPMFRPYINEVMAEITPPIIDSLLHPMTARAYYLPADRTGIMHAHQVVVSSIIRGSIGGGLRSESPVETLSGVLADFLERLISLERGRIVRSSRRKVVNGADEAAKEIEQRLLFGKIRKEDSPTGYPRFFYQPEGWSSTIPLMRSSSMVSELAPIVLYLRYVVQSGDVLIIEEPEAHLHPALQREFTRQVAALVKAGVRVIITTHSEWVLEELANIVYSSEISDLKAVPNRAKDPLALTDDKVGIWLFDTDEDNSGSVVSELKLDRESGSFDTGYDEVSRSLYNRFAGIANLIESGRQ